MGRKGDGKSETYIGAAVTLDETERTASAGICEMGDESRIFYQVRVRMDSLQPSEQHESPMLESKQVPLSAHSLELGPKASAQVFPVPCLVPGTNASPP